MINESETCTERQTVRIRPSELTEVLKRAPRDKRGNPVVAAYIHRAMRLLLKLEGAKARKGKR